MTYNPLQPTEDHPRVVVACRSLKPELEALRPGDVTIEIRYLEQNLHRTPELMPGIIQNEIDGLDYASQIVLGYGLCSNGVVGLVAPRQGLIIPRVHDCITLFLGSRQAYDEAFQERPGTYYLTPGWIAEGKDPLGYMEQEYTPKLGHETAEWGIKEELKHYTHMVLIDTRVTDVIPLRKRAVENARFLGKHYQEVTGRHNYFQKILYGPYNLEDFVVIEPGGMVEQRFFFR